MTTTIGQYTSPLRQAYNITYENTKGNKTFVAQDNWLVYADRFHGPRHDQFFFHGQLFVDGKLVDGDYEISEAQLRRWFPVEVGA